MPDHKKKKSAKKSKSSKKKPVKKAKTSKKRVKKVARPTKDTGSLLNFKADKTQRKIITAKAKRFTKGNLSAWLRLAGMTARPTKTQIKTHARA